MGKLGKSEDRVWYFYKNVKTGEHTMTTWDRMTDYFGWIEVTQKDYNQWVVSRELAPADAPAAPAPATDAGEADAPRTDLDADTLDHWPRMFRERCTADHWEGLYNDAAKNDMLDALDVIATLKQQLAAANDELDKAKAREKMYKHTVELHEEQYHQERDNARVLYRELRQHMSREQLEAIQKQLNNSVNEDDKLMSDASRGREAMAKLAAAAAAQTFLAGVPVTQLAVWNTNGATLHKLLKNIYTQGTEFTLTDELMQMFGIDTEGLQAAEGAKGE